MPFQLLVTDCSRIWSFTSRELSDRRFSRLSRVVTARVESTAFFAVPDLHQGIQGLGQLRVSGSVLRQQGLDCPIQLCTSPPAPFWGLRGIYLVSNCFLITFHRFVKWAECRKAEAGFDNLQTFIASTIDAMLFAQSFCNAAEEKGLGICYLGTTAYNADQIIEALSLPRLVVPIVTVTVGYPAEPIPAQVERLPLAAVVQNETYTDFTPASIDALYGEKEALEVNKQFVRENNKETLAQVFTDVRYTKKNSEYFSEVLLKVLKQQGFMK